MVRVTTKDNIPLSDKAENLDENLMQFEFMNMSRDNSNTLQPTGIFTTLKALNRLVIQQIEERENQRVINKTHMDAMSKRFIDRMDRPLFTIAAAELS